MSGQALGSGGGGSGAGAMDEDDLAALKGEIGVDDERLKAVLAEESGRVSDAPAATMWRGHEIPIRNREAHESMVGRCRLTPVDSI